MNSKGQLSVGAVVVLFMGVIVALAIFPSIMDQQNQATSLLAAPNESTSLASCVMLNSSNGGWDINVSDVDCNVTADNWYTVKSATDWRLNESQCYISSVTVRNGTSSALTVNVDYRVFSANGTIQFLDTVDTRNLTANTSYLAYSFCDEGYNKDSSSRGIANLWGLLAALALLGFVAYGIRHWQK